MSWERSGPVSYTHLDVYKRQRVVWIGELSAFSTMVLEGNIAAPPTIGSLMPAVAPICATALHIVTANAATAMEVSHVFFIDFVPFDLLQSPIPELSAH